MPRQIPDSIFLVISDENRFANTFIQNSSSISFLMKFHILLLVQKVKVVKTGLKDCYFAGIVTIIIIRNAYMNNS